VEEGNAWGAVATAGVRTLFIFETIKTAKKAGLWLSPTTPAFSFVFFFLFC
jgi:hypothetical protein